MQSDGDTASYIVQLEEALNAFDGALIATMITVPGYIKAFAQLRERHKDVLNKAIPAVLARRAE